MRKLVLLVVFLGCFLALSAYTIGQYTKTFTDPARNNRQILTWIYYPIDDNNPQSTFPYIIFGHGWNGDCTYYTTFTNAIVNLGWIVAYPRTEEGIFGYSTSNLAMDMAFLKDAVFLETMNIASPIYTKLDTLAIVGGYSMGGACAVAAATIDTSFASLVTLAAAPITLLNLYPAAINMATTVIMPSVTFSGSADVIAPPNANQIPIYNNLASNYKSFVSFTGQVHDSFYNNPLIPVILAPWFNYLKTGSVYYIDQFESVLDSYPASSLTYQIVNNLVIELDTPVNVMIDVNNGQLEISWDRDLEAHSYKVFASDYPDTDFADISTEGTFTEGSRFSWTTPITTDVYRFYYVTSNR